MVIWVWWIVGLLLAGCASTTVNEPAARSNAELGLQYMTRGNYERALEKLERALGYDPDSVLTHHYLAELYRRLERPKESEQHFLEAISLSREGDSRLYNNYGVFLCERQRVEEARQQFERVLQNPVYPKADIYENLGFCYQKVGDNGVAESYFRQALGLKPERAKSLLAMAQLSFEQGKTLSTRAWLQRLHAVQPPTAETLWLGIQVERQLGDFNSADQLGKMLMERFAESEQAANYLETIKP